MAITIGPKAVCDARDSGELRLVQSGAGLFTLDGTFNVMEGGVVEALAPSGSLTAHGRIRTPAVPVCRRAGHSTLPGSSPMSR